MFQNITNIIKKTNKSCKIENKGIHLKLNYR